MIDIEFMLKYTKNITFVICLSFVVLSQEKAFFY